MPSPLYLIDGSGFIFRAYHALPPLNRADGTPVNAVLGFVNMVLRLLKDQQATHVAVIFDAARKNFRNDIYPDYKAHRPPPPEDLVPQFPLIRAATQAFSLPSIEMEGFEADDLIATYARLARAAGQEVVIVSSDKDLLQVITDGVTLMDPIKQTLLGPEAAIEKFGVPPHQVIDVQALCGDSVDNVPGVPGIGIKTAAALIGEFGTLENLLANAGTIKQDKRRQALLDHADAARLSYRLVCLDAHVPATVPLSNLRPHDPGLPDLPAFLQAQGFHSVLKRLGAAPPTAPTDTAAPIPKAAPPTPQAIACAYELIQTEADLQRWVHDIRAAGLVAVDCETNDLTPARADLVGISLCVTPGTAAYIPLLHRAQTDLLGGGQAVGPQLPMATVMHHLGPVLTDPSILKIGHNIKFDLQLFLPHGIHVAPVADTMILSYVLDNTRHAHNLQDLAKLHLGLDGVSYDAVTGTGKNRITFDLVPLEQARDYAAEDADFTRRLYDVLWPRLHTEHQHHIYQDIDRPIIPVIAQMESTGIKIDAMLLQNLSHDFGQQLLALEQKIFADAGHPFNVASPKQLGTVLFDELGLPGGARTKTGDWSTSADILEDLSAQGHSIVDLILDYRGLAKLKSTYTDTLAAQINPRTGRVHTSFALALTSTGRLSSSDPNLQNIPIRTENGRKIRAAFVADEGHVLISVDYSQIELRLIAEMAGIKALQQAFLDGADIHAITASQVFGVPLEGMDPMIRRQAKAINFGIIYGISGFGLAKQLGVDAATANGYIRAYFERFPELKTYFETTKNFARTHGYVTTLAGRKIYIDGIADKNASRRAFAERQAINAPVQGTAADIMKQAMSRVPAALARAGLTARLLLQVHDELVLEAPIDTAERVGQTVKATMESVSPFPHPLTAAFGIGPNWDQAH